jgi:FMN-dependent NADH-azoreductase
MPRILRVDASSRVENSHSRAIGDLVEAKLIAALRASKVVRRDVGVNPPPHIRNDTIEAMFGVAGKRRFGAGRATRLSDAIIAELTAADAIVITTPMYNFGIPSALKAWLDQLVRIGKTFSFENGNFHGLLASKPVYVVAAYGAPGYTDAALKSADFVRPYLEFILRFVGLSDLRFVAIEGTSGSAESTKAARANAVAQVDALFSKRISHAA